MSQLTQVFLRYKITIQNIPVHLFSKSMNQLVSSDTIEISDYKDETIATYGLKYAAVRKWL